jgi:hypothetical protein
VTISGFVSGVSATNAVNPGPASRSAFVCWDACPGGLAFEDVAVRWSKDNPGAYSLSFTVPAAPWLEVDGLHQPTAGAYTVGVQCLTAPGTRLVGGCATRPPDATASFTLTGDTPLPCATDNCTSLQLTPAEAAPGTLVHVSGSAPLAQHVINESVCCWDVVLDTGGAFPAEVTPLKQARDGTLSGSFRAPLTLPDTGPLAAGSYVLALRTSIDGDTAGEPAGSTLVGTPTLSITTSGPGLAQALLSAAPFTLDAAPSWSTLSATTPIAITRSTPLTGPVVTTDDGSPGRAAVCVADGIAVSADSGGSWNTVPTDGARQEIVAAGFAAYPDASDSATGPLCLDALLEATHPDSVYATFEVAKPPYGAPPIVNLGLFSTDGGATWQSVPPPDGAVAAGFGGFFRSSTGVEALFATDAGTNGLAVQLTEDGGQTWTTTALDCPAEGPCVRWGPAANTLGSCAMHEYLQPLLVSLNGGARFAQPSWPDAGNGCFLNELVTLSASNLLLLRGQDEFPLVASSDGGASWQTLALPPLPSTSQFDLRYDGLQMLPNGALIARGTDGWYLLSPAAASWCGIDSALLSADASLVQADGPTVWVFTNFDGHAAPTAIDAATLLCAGG